MRYVLIICGLCLSISGYAQKIGGIVIDKTTGQRISGAWVSTASANTISDMAGAFTIGPVKGKDTLKVRMQGYQPFAQPLSSASLNDVVVQLEQLTIQLNQVNISARRDRVKDSLNNRRDFAKDFNSHPPKFSDIIRPASMYGIPYLGVSISASQLITALTYKHSRAYKFKKVLIADEQSKYIDSRFSEERVAQLTNLPADSLVMFMDRYRPGIEQVRKMSDYDLFNYVKRSLTAFKADKDNKVKEAEF